MPSDPTLPATSAHHRDGSAPYPCHAWQHPPGSDWGLEYGYCRTSLDWHGPGNPQGQGVRVARAAAGTRRRKAWP